MALLITDELWKEIEPLLPPPKPRHFRYPRAYAPDNRRALAGIVFVLKSGIPWEMLPGEMEVCGMTCLNNPREWQEAGVWDRLLALFVKKRDDADKLNWERGTIDSSSVRAVHGGDKTGPNRVDRARPGFKHHVITEGGGIPIAVEVTAANVNDIMQIKPLVEKIPVIREQKTHRKKDLGTLLGDRAYDSEPHENC